MASRSKVDGDGAPRTGWGKRRGREWEADGGAGHWQWCCRLQMVVGGSGCRNWGGGGQLGRKERKRIWLGEIKAKVIS